MKARETRPQSGGIARDNEPSRPHEPAAPQPVETEKRWGWLGPEDVEPADAARFDNATFDNATWG